MRLIKSRKFWASVVGVVAVIAEVYGRGLNQEELISLVMVLVSYIISVSANPGINKSKLIETLQSRRFWATVISVVFILANAFYLDLPLPKESFIELFTLISAYIVGTGLEEWRKKTGIA